MSATDKWGHWQVVIGIIGVIIALVGLMVAITPHDNPNANPSTNSNNNTNHINIINNLQPSTPTPTSTPTQNSISVTSSPVGASIYLEDGTYEGETPKILKDVEQGSHIITLKRAGYADWSQGIDVDPDKTISISPTLTQISAVTPIPSSDVTPTPLATTSPKPPVTPTPLDISPYLDWSFTTAKDNFYVTVPDGYSFVSVTVKIHNDGDDPISTDSSCWKFISGGVSYSCEPVTTAFNTPSQYEIKPGESLTFIINYLVKGVPTTGSLQYSKPTYYT